MVAIWTLAGQGEVFTQCGLAATKSEARNSKFETTSNEQNSKENAAVVQERAKSSLVNPKRDGRRTKAIHLHKKGKTGDEDLVEFAAIQTLLNGGTVYLVEPEKRFG